MALITCKDCSTEVSSNAKACPQCGAPVGPKHYSIGKLIVLLGLGVLVYSLLFPSGPKQLTAAQKQNRADNSALYAAKQAVKARLRDPDSAQFRNVYVSRAEYRHPVVCGQVNAANGMGGMSGFRAFYSSGDYTALAEDAKEPQQFADTLRQVCIK